MPLIVKLQAKLQPKPRAVVRMPISTTAGALCWGCKPAGATPEHAYCGCMVMRALMSVCSSRRAFGEYSIYSEQRLDPEPEVPDNLREDGRQL